MAPNKKAKDRDCQARERDKLVAKNVLAREVGDQFTDYAHAGQDHDVDRRVRVKPEQMLKEHWIAARSRIENSNVGQAFESQQYNCDRDDKSSQNHNERRGI